MAIPRCLKVLWNSIYWGRSAVLLIALSSFIVAYMFMLGLFNASSDNSSDFKELQRENDYLRSLDPQVDMKELKLFARKKYQARRSVLHKTCDSITDSSVLSSLTSKPEKWQSYIWYNFDRRYSFCGVAKVASSTWRQHNRDLVGPERFDAYLHKLEQQGIGNSWYSKVSYHFAPLPKNMSIQEAGQQLLTFVFVRHPFARLVSAYTDKMENKPGTKMTYWIIEKYRKKAIAAGGGQVVVGQPVMTDLPKDYPTPLEFSLHVLADAEKYGIENINPHWQSQWGCCPFCTLEFDIIGHLETFQTDMDFVTDAMNWHGILQEDRHENSALSSRNDGELKMREFFSQLPKNITWKLYQLYALDFAMFGYGGPEQWYSMGY